MPEPEADTTTMAGRTFEFKLGGDAPEEVRAQVAEFVRTVRSPGLGGIARRRSALMKLRATPEPTVAAVARGYDALAKERFEDRWALVHLLAEVRHRTALDRLKQVVEEPLVMDQTSDPHARLAVREETMIRLAAIEGIGALLGAGQAEARHVLLEQLRHPVFSVRRAVVQELLRRGGAEARQDLARRLPASDRHILDIRVISGRDIPAVTPPARPRRPGHAAGVRPPARARPTDRPASNKLTPNGQ